MRHVLWRRLPVVRFLCRAAWRCTTCDTPWNATGTLHKAIGYAMQHEYRIHRGAT